ncbi:ABC transporter substrate-binding protein [Acidisphaera sp. L21]|uniref:ABC transporter substrate-binding protein n=1 Tax=Acidisphaera sp. L21 TaxID=1641851 RepID=UPI00131B30C0|nr:ABC transporter substrate-binding protein [Acidisphaera sp. L21]
MTSSSRFLLGRRSLIAGAASVGLAGTADAQSPQRGGTMVMIVQPEPATLAAYLSVAGNIAPVTTQIYEGLVTYDWSLKPAPKLAKSWEIAPDGLSITFHLQDGVTFHNGAKFTSADVQYAFMQVLKKVHPRAPVVLADLTAVDTPDPLTAVFRLSHPAPYLMMSLSGYDAPILCKSVFENVDPAANPTANKPIGTGPFKFGSWERGQYIRLDRNPNYWQNGLPYLDRIIARFIADSSTRSAALETGEAHYAAFSAVNYSDVARLKANPMLDTTSKGYEMFSGISEIELNEHRPPFDKREVRQAIAYAIDRKFIIDNIQYGFGKPATGPISSTFAASGLYTDDVLRFDVPDRIAIANKLLDDAGLKRGEGGMRFATTLEVNSFGQQWQRQAEYLKQALAVIGIDLTLRSEDTGAWLRRVYTNYDYGMSEPFFSNLSDPVIGVQRQYVTNQIRKGVDFVNNTFYSNPEVDTLFTAGAQEIDPAKRAEIYHKIQKILVTDSPVIWLTEIQYVTVFNRKLHDATTGPLGTYSAFERTWIEH